MCSTCGCGHTDELLIDDGQFRALDPKAESRAGLGVLAAAPAAHRAAFSTAPPAPPPAVQPPVSSRMISLERDVLHENQLLAERNRGYFEGRNILALNLVSSPGSGKTALLERTLSEPGLGFAASVIEGDQHSSRDAERIRATGTRAVQINTGKGCHLDAQMVRLALDKLQPEPDSVLFIENVGNLVCPALFDLGESARVVIMSVTEGEDKPLKYPDMFHSAQLCIINKTDLLPYVSFSVEKALEYARRVNPGLEFLELSCSSGEGLSAWYQWLQARRVPAALPT
jgi:hydrogenase nickel incorporation protein HypB